MHDIFVVEFADLLGWNGLGVFWYRSRIDGETSRYFEARKRHCSILFNEAIFEPDYNFAACVYCQHFGAISGFHRLRIREDKYWNEKEAAQVQRYLGAIHFESRESVELYTRDFPPAYRLARDFRKAFKLGQPPIAYFHRNDANILVEEVYDFEAKEWKSPQREVS